MGVSGSYNVTPTRTSHRDDAADDGCFCLLRGVFCVQGETEAGGGETGQRGTTNQIVGNGILFVSVTEPLWLFIGL